MLFRFFFFFKQKTAYELRISDWSSDVCSSDLVAIATDGAELFGTGSTSVRTAQDLSIYSGIPPLVRSGDWFAASFTLRNGSDKPMKVTAKVDLQPHLATGRPLTVTIPAGGAAPVAWNLTAPEGISNLKWHVTARSEDGKTDQITVDQQVVPALPTSVLTATLPRVSSEELRVGTEWVHRWRARRSTSH